MGVPSPEMEQDNLELVPVSEQRRLYPDYGAWLAACRDNPGPSSSYTCPVSGISKNIIFAQEVINTNIPSSKKLVM